MRVGRSVSGTTTTYLQDLASGLPHVLAETSAGTTTRYTYGMDQIAQVSKEQALGIEQISKAISDIDKSTQQSAAQSEELMRTMAAFQTSQA